MRMSVHISVQYLGDLRCEATHGPSQNQFLTDAPVDNQGKGEAFSPTDLVATALGTCMATTMGIFARRHEIDLRGLSVSVEKEMTTDPPRRIARLTTELRLPLPANHPQREALERAALSCPVHRSLHPDVEQPIKFVWQDDA
ncbi:MAG: putative redox protein [Chthoniobacter sp.]|nr:putative redox protein [Chthoniobacter sp.]